MLRSESSTPQGMRHPQTAKLGLIFGVLLIFLVLSGCRQLEGFLPGPKVDAARVVSMPAGGSITIPEGALPPGAQITATLGETPLLPDGLRAVGQAVAITSPATPTEPVLLRLPIPAGAGDPSSLVIVRVESNGTTTALMTEVEGGWLLAYTPGFSTFEVAELLDINKVELVGPARLLPHQPATYRVSKHRMSGSWAVSGDATFVHQSGIAATLRAGTTPGNLVLTYQGTDLASGMSWWGKVTITVDEQLDQLEQQAGFRLSLSTDTPIAEVNEPVEIRAITIGNPVPPISWSWQAKGCDFAGEKTTTEHVHLFLPKMKCPGNELYQVEVTAIDRDGRGTSSTIDIRVIPRHFEVQLSGPRQIQWQESGVTAQFRAAANDGAGPPYKFNWKTWAHQTGEGTGIFDPFMDLSILFNEPGEHRVAVVASDGDGTMASATLPLRVEGGEPLSARLLNLPESAKPGAELKVMTQIRGGVLVVSGQKRGYRLLVDWGDGNTQEITAIGYDPEKNINRTPFQGTATPVSHRYRNGGEYTVKIQAFDSTGSVATETRQIRVADRPITALASDSQGPAVTIISHRTAPPWSQVSEGTIILAGSATDRGRGGSGIHAVYINDSLADSGGSVAGDGVVSWRETLHLNPGWNEITVTAYDDSAHYNTTAELIRIYYPSPDAPQDDIPPPPPPVLTANLDCGDSFELAPGDFVGRGCHLVVRGWHNTDARVYVDVDYDQRSGIELFPKADSQHPMNMADPGYSVSPDRYFFLLSFRAKRDAPPGVTPFTITVRQAGAETIVLSLNVAVLREGLIPSYGPGIRPPAEIATGSGGEFCVWRYKSFGDRPECFNFVRAGCATPRYAAPRYELVGRAMTWRESGVRMAQLGSYHQDAYGCHAWQDTEDQSAGVDVPGDPHSPPDGSGGPPGRPDLPTGTDTGGTSTISTGTVQGAPVLKLVRIEGPEGDYTRSGMKIAYKAGASGFSLSKRKEWTGNYTNWDRSKRWTPNLWRSELASFRLSSFPLEIVMGQAFSFAADLRIRHGYSASHDCYDPPKAGDDPLATGAWRYAIEMPPLRSKALPKTALNNHCDVNVVCGRQYGVSAGSDGIIVDHPCRTGVTEKDGEITLNARYIPVEIKKKGDTRLFRYRLDHDGTVAESDEEGGPIELDLFADWQNERGEYGSWDGVTFRVELIGLDLAGATMTLHYRPVPQQPVVVAEYDHPDAFKVPPRSEPWPGHEEEAMVGSMADSDPEVQTWDDPQRIDPANPQVSPLIREWITTARPPENAVEGNNVRYSGKGNIIGTVVGGIIESRHETGEVDPAYLWANRRLIDSVDHCTMEEFVLARLKSESINHCAGRYGAVRNLKGLRLADARTAVTGAGFAYSLAPGSPAKTPEDEGTVEKQEPGPEHFLKKGQAIRLTIHAPHMPKTVPLPDFIGKPLAEARKWLELNGLKFSLQPGSPAPAAALSGTVEKQDPAAGTGLTKGSTVTLTIHSAYVDLRSVPDIYGLVQDAAGSRLEQAGLVMDRRDAGRPAESRLANTVQKQDPAPGTSIAKGSAVVVWVYGQFTPSREERVAVTDCSQYPRSRAYWDETAGGPRCGCFDGLVWNLATSHCVPADVRANEVCAREMPGTSARGRTPEGKINCVCPDGQFWNASQRRCERQLAEPAVERSCTIDASMYHGKSNWCHEYTECHDAECRVHTVHVVNDDHLQRGFTPPQSWKYNFRVSCLHGNLIEHKRKHTICR